MDLEDTYTQCKEIIDEEVKNKQMGWIYRVLLQKAIDENLFFCIHQRKKILAFAICRYLPKYGLLSIDKLGVHPDYRQHGLGTRLLDQIKKSGLSIKLDVVQSNQSAVQFYLKNGFRPVGTKILGQNVPVSVMLFKKLTRNGGSETPPITHSKRGMGGVSLPPQKMKKRTVAGKATRRT
jgi:GNAT superfamily N-acetyltransferase